MRVSRTRRWRRPSARSSRTYRRDRAAQDTEMLTLFEAGDLHPRIAYVLYGEPAYASPEASACAGQFRKSPLGVLCHERRRSTRRYVTVREMKEGPSGSAIRSLIPSHRELLRSKAVVVSVAETLGQVWTGYARDTRP